MKIAPSSAATKPPTRRSTSVIASAVPTRTGAMAAGSVRGRAAMSQIRTGPALRSPRELREVGAALLDVGVAALLGLVAHVEEQRRVAGELLDAGEPVVGGVERRLQHPQGERREREHLAAPLDGLLLEALERHDRVDEAPVERRLRVVLAAEEPHLHRALAADLAGEQARAEAAVERADLRAGLPEPRVVRRDRQVAADVEHVAAADRVPGDHRHDRLRAAAHLDLQVEDVQPPDALLGDRVVADVAVVATDALVAAGAERLVALAGEDDDADGRVVLRERERLAQLEQGLGPEGVAHLGPVDRDLRDALAVELVADVRVLAGGGPGD